MSAGLLALIAGGLGGYMQGTKDKAEQDRLNEDRAYQNEVRAREKKKYAEEDALNESLKTAGTNAQVAEETVDPIVANSGVESATPNITNPMSIIAKKRYKVGDQVFEGDDGKIKAEQQVKKMNNPIAKAGRLADVYDSAGKFDVAQKYRDWANTAKEQGLMKAVEMIHAGDVNGGIDYYNRTGDDRVDPNTVKAEPIEMTGPGGVKIKGYRVTGLTADSKPFSIDNTAEFLQRHQDFDKQYSQQLQGAQVDVAKQNADTNESFHNATIALENKKLGLEGQKLSIMRSRGTGGAGGGQAATTAQPEAAFRPIGREDSKAVLETAKNLFPDDPMKANKVAMIGAQLQSANPNMTPMEAIQLAGQDGGQIVNRKVMLGDKEMIVPTLTFTDQKSGKANFYVMAPNAFSATIEPPPQAPAMPSPQKSGILPFLNNEPSKPQPSGRVLSHQLNVANQKLMADPQLKAIDQQLAELDKLPNRVAMNKRGALEAAKQQRINELQGK